MYLKDLHHLPVETRSGVPLGRLVDLEIDPETCEVRTFFVATRRLLPGLMDRRLAVGRQQVVRLTPQKLVVDDSLIPLPTRVGITTEPEAPTA